MLKRIFIFVTLLLSLSLVVFPKGLQAEGTEPPQSDLSVEVYDQLVIEDVVDETITYDTWIDINVLDSFDELESEIPVPNVLMDIETSNEVPEILNTSLRNFSLMSASDDMDVFGDMDATATRGPALKKGDILVSNGTSSFGLTGHAGIAISSSQVLHIPGKNSNPLVISTKQWQDRYGIVRGQKEGNNTHTKVYRVGSTANAGKAAEWAESNYKGKKYGYGVTTNLLSKDPTYCSKIVWQAYNSIGAVTTPSSKIATPYGLPKYFKSNQNLKGMGYL